MFDVLVIGKGLMGSAAARYLQAFGVNTAVLSNLNLVLSGQNWILSN